MATTFSWVLPSPAASTGQAQRSGGDNLGVDIMCVSGLDPHFRLVSGPSNVAAALARRFATPRGRLFYAPNYGEDLSVFANGDVSRQTLSSVARMVEREALKDPRVHSIRPVVQWDPDAQTIRVSSIGMTQSGAFPLVMSVSNAAVKLLSPEA